MGDHKDDTDSGLPSDSERHDNGDSVFDPENWDRFHSSEGALVGGFPAASRAGETPRSSKAFASQRTEPTAKLHVAMDFRNADVIVHERFLGVAARIAPQVALEMADQTNIAKLPTHRNRKIKPYSGT